MLERLDDLDPVAVRKRSGYPKQLLHEHNLFFWEKTSPSTFLFLYALERKLMAFPHTPSIVEHADILVSDLF